MLQPTQLIDLSSRAKNSPEISRSALSLSPFSLPPSVLLDTHLDLQKVHRRTRNSQHQRTRSERSRSSIRSPSSVAIDDEPPEEESGGEEEGES